MPAPVTSPSADRTSATSRPLALAVALLFTAALLWTLHWHFQGATKQLLCGDELHAPRVALFYTYSQICTYYDTSDNSIPYTLYIRWLLKHGWFDEFLIRIPVLASHVALLCSPLLLARRVGWATAFGACALLATTPLAVHYALVARPYTPAALMMTLSLCTWAAWVSAPRLATLVAFCVTSVLATFLHMYCLFPVLALLAVGALGSRWAAYRFRTIFLAGLAIGAGLAVLYLPGLEGLREHRLNKVGLGEELSVTMLSSWSTVVANLRAFGVALIAASLLGIVALARRAPLVCSGIVGMVVFQVLALIATRPIGEPNVWARYFFPVLPALLVLAAAGLALLGTGLARLLPVSARARVHVAGVVGVLLASALAYYVRTSSPQTHYQLGASSLRTNREFLLCLSFDPNYRSRVFQHVYDDPERGDTLVVYPSFDMSRAWGELAREGLRDMWVKGAWHAMDFLRESGLDYKHVLDVHNDAELRASGAKYLLADAIKSPPRELHFLLQRFGRPVVRDEHCLLFDLTPLTERPR